MTNWIQTKAGLQMAETINRYMPRMLVCLEELAKDKSTIELDSCDLSTGYKAELKKEIQSGLRAKLNKTYGEDILRLIDEMDIRKQENINLKFQLDEMKSQLEKVLSMIF